jgi:hypothetical protein
MSEVNAALRWIDSKLRASVTLCSYIGVATPRIYDGVVIQATPAIALPYVVYQYQGGSDLMTNGTFRIWANALYLVRGVAVFPFTSLDAIAVAIDTALHGLGGTIAAGTVYSATRQQPFEMYETTDGVRYKHMGGIYRIYSK